MEVEFWQDGSGFSPYHNWINNHIDDGSQMAESMIACLKVMGLKCKFVKDLKLDGLYELRSKSQKVRVYFFMSKDMKVSYITGVGHKSNQKRDIIDSYNIMMGWL